LQKKWAKDGLNSQKASQLAEDARPKNAKRGVKGKKRTVPRKLINNSQSTSIFVEGQEKRVSQKEKKSNRGTISCRKQNTKGNGNSRNTHRENTTKKETSGQM